MICIFVILLIGWCRTRMRRARLVSNAFLYTTHVRNKYSLLSQALYTAVVVNVIKLNDIVNSALNYCTGLLKRWICMISTQIFNKNSTFEVDYNRDIDLGEYSFCSIAVPSQSGSVH